MSLRPTGSGAPIWARTALAHAAAQALAELLDLDVLHVKGDALHPLLRAGRGPSQDADILVRSSQAERFIDAARRRGWRVESTFRKGSPFEHAATLSHVAWGLLDVHRLFPGIGLDPELAFDRLWADREIQLIAGYPCTVPSLAAQMVVVVLNAARSPDRRSIDLANFRAIDEGLLRSQVRQLVADLDASVAFAAGTGRLDEQRGQTEYELWRVVSEGGTRIDEWRARAAAAPTRRAAVWIIIRSVMVNTEHLRVVLGHEPSRREIAREFVARPLRGLREEVVRALRRFRRTDG